jgi:protein-L-isoaspartate(D-aspartate) O-methyltransferase
MGAQEGEPVDRLIRLVQAPLFLMCLYATACTQGKSESLRGQNSTQYADTVHALSPDDRAAEREAMVEHILAHESVRITDERVIRALRAVPRHRFVPANQETFAYSDSPLPIGLGQTISQPIIVALMTQLAEVDSGDAVLEVGTGSGYQAAILATMGARVYTIEILKTLAARAAHTLQTLGYDSVQVKAGDGYVGWPEHAPFDAILVTAAPDSMPAPLVEQLAPGGKLVVPIGRQGALQQLQVMTKNPDGTTRTEISIPVLFVPLVRERR